MQKENCLCVVLWVWWWSALWESVIFDLHFLIFGVVDYVQEQYFLVHVLPLLLFLDCIGSKNRKMQPMHKSIHVKFMA